MGKDNLGNRMKMYEAADDTKFMRGIPIVVRIDGKGFSKYTKNLKRPFDSNLRDIFTECAMYIIKETNADIAYHQSDEMTFIFKNKSTKDCKVWFGGRKQKILSVMSSLMTAKFNSLSSIYTNSFHGFNVVG